MADYNDDELLNQTNCQRLAEARAQLHGLMRSGGGIGSTSADGISIQFKKDELLTYIAYLQPLCDNECGENMFWQVVPNGP